MIPFTVQHIRRVIGVVIVTALMIAFTGAAIFAMIYHVSPYAATRGFSGYFAITVLFMLLHLVRLTYYKTTLDYIVDLLLEISNKVDTLSNEVHQADL